MTPNMFDGIGTLIRFGIFGIIVAVASVVVGVPLGVWWLFHHISIH